MNSPSVIVIGAGIVGCTIAHQLARSGAHVRVIETRQPGQGATRASAGILAPYIEGHESAVLRALGRRSLDQFDSFITGLRAGSGHNVVYQRNGTFELAFDDADVGRLTALSAMLSSGGIDNKWVPPQAFGDYEPLASGAARGALFIATHGFVGVTSVTLAAAAAAERLGATITTETGAIRIHSLAAGRVGVESAGVSWDADRVVLAAGSWSSQISVEGAEHVPVKPIRGQLIQLKAEPGALRRVMWGPTGYLVPWPDGTVLVGSTVEDVGFDERHTEAGVQSLLATAAALAPSLADAPMTAVRTGLRPRGPDDLPILGHSAVVPGLIYATAHYRNGVMLTPLTVQLVDDLVFHRAGDPALRDLDPARHGRL
ncbi:MAG: glycine oxidase ThiO [Acidobacteriota bacterium]|nr:glycine oxidase ThiO [Acidobacteriota bacterium]